MIVKQKTTVEQEVEITLPHFFKLTWRTDEWVYAILSEDIAASVKGTAIETTKYVDSFGQFIGDDNYVECSKEDFIRAFDAANESIQQLVKTNL